MNPLECVGYSAANVLYTFEVHDAEHGSCFEPDNFDDIKDAGMMKAGLKSMAHQMSAGKIGKCFGGDRSGGGGGGGCD